MRDAVVRRAPGADKEERRLPVREQILTQIFLIIVAFTVLFPILWIVSLSFDNIERPSEFRLVPQEFTVSAYQQVFTQPTSNPTPFWRLLLNQLMLAGGVAFASVMVGVFAAYAFSRLKFPGRGGFMLGIIAVLLLPQIATIAPLYIILNGISPQLRGSFLGVGIAMTSGALPFAIWNLKGYLDTIPKDLEEAARIDGASPNQIFFQIVLPLAVPALAVTAFLGFLSGWTEFALSWQFLDINNPNNLTLAMALYTMTGQYASEVPWSRFAAMSLLIAAPVAIVYLSLQRYIVGGLTVGGVK